MNKPIIIWGSGDNRLGFLLRRQTGLEAFGMDGVSLGVFSHKQAAIRAVYQAFGDTDGDLDALLSEAGID
jgi:hypothetical protein